MATIRLVPSTYSRSSTSANRVNVSNETNMYNNTDNTSNYATLRGRSQNSTTAYYVFIHGFNFDDIPSNATVNSFTVKIRCYRSSNQRSGTTYNLRLASTPSSNSVISNTTASTAIGTTTSVITIPTGNLTWSQLSGYGSNFSIEVPLSSNANSYPYVYVYGAEILLDVTVPMHDVSFNNTSQSVTTVPSSTQSIIEGHDQVIEFYGITNLNNVVVEDNGTDIKSQLVLIDNGTPTFNPSSLVASNGTVTNPNNGLTGVDSDTYAQTNGQYQYYLTYGFDVSEIPQTATINSVVCQAKVQHTRNSSNSGEVQLYSDSSEKGSPTTFGNTVTTVNLSTGTWTRSELSNIRIRIGNTYNGGTTTYYTRFYGANLTINYTVNETYYTYTISNIQADHVISVSDKQTGSSLYWKNGSWSQYTKIYKKANNSWVQQTISLDLFDGNKIIVSG